MTTHPQPLPALSRDLLFVVGVSFRTAPVSVREQLAVAHPDREAVSRLIQARFGLIEMVPIWTCNRVEIYGVRDSVGWDPRDMMGCLSEQAPLLASHVYCHEGAKAQEHLLRVTSGLESMVLGDMQITGQVKDAYHAALKAGQTGKILNRLFQKAFQTAKAIRTRTMIGQGAMSVGGMAVNHAEAVFGNGLKGKSVLVLGAGKMAVSCLRHLRKWGVERVWVANRSPERAAALVEEFNAEYVPLDGKFGVMADVDIVISSTGSPDVIVTAADVEPVMRGRPERPLVIIDIAVPRDIDPGVAGVEGVHLHDIDALEATVKENLALCEQDVRVCRELLEKQLCELRPYLPTWPADLEPVRLTDPRPGTQARHCRPAKGKEMFVTATSTGD